MEPWAVGSSQNGGFSYSGDANQTSPLTRASSPTSSPPANPCGPRFPNTNANVRSHKIREGMTIVTPLPDARSRALILAIFTSCGRCRFLDEKHFDACTALAGSGPAFVSLVLEAMADGAVMMGLPRTEALEIAAQSESEPLSPKGDVRGVMGGTTRL